MADNTKKLGEEEIQDLKVKKPESKALNAENLESVVGGVNSDKRINWIDGDEKNRK